MIEIIQNSPLLQLPEKKYGTVKRVGILNNEPILYGDVNQVKPGSLFYLASVKQVYRYVKPDATHVDLAHMKFIKYYFDTIKPTTTDGLLVPEEERGHIRNAGYLFNEIIYSGDPNLVENGNLFYHDTLPYISIVSNANDIINLSTKELDEEGEVTTVITEYRVSPEPEIALVISDIDKDTYYYIRNLDEDTTVDDVVYYAWKDANDDNSSIYFTESETPNTESLLYKLVDKDMLALVGYSITDVILAKDIPTE